MGRGNVCTTGRYEGLWYIDNDFLAVYRHKDTDERYMENELGYEQLTSGDYEYDQIDSEYEYEAMVEMLRTDITEKFHSFRYADKWVSNHGNRCDRHAILENNLFFIALEDNECSVAVELLQKGPEELAGLQARHYEHYLEAIKNIILDMYGQVSYRNGAWMSGTIKKEDVANETK